MAVKLNVENIFKSIDDYFAPRIIGEVNDSYIKLAKIKGDKIPWHNHQHEDEMFFILSGELLFEEEGKKPFTMKKGDMYIVKKGINHKVSSKTDCHIMLVENKSTKHTGDIKTAITKTIKEQKVDFTAG